MLIKLLMILCVLGYVRANTSGTYPDGCTNIFVTNTLQSVQDNAMSYCQSQGTGGSLAIIKDASTANFIHDRINSGSPYWIGATYNGNNQWVWNDGTVIGQPGYNGWTPGYPADSSNKRCLVIEKSSDGTPSKWYNVACNNAQKLPSICQVAVSAAVLCDPCTHRKQCTVTGCQYKCESCVNGYYGEDCRYLNTTFVETNQKSIKKNNSLNLKFSCTFAGFPLPNITWLFNENEINTDDVNYDIATTINPELDEIQQTLTIYQPRCVGNTTVTCRGHQNYTNVVNRSLSIDPGFQLIQNFTASTEQCSVARVYVNWTNDILLPQDLKSLIEYKIFVTDINGSSIYESQKPIEVGVQEIEALQENTTYSVMFLATVETCGEHVNKTSTATIRTQLGIPHQPRNATVIDESLSPYTCSVHWNKPDSPPLEKIQSFTIIALGETANTRNSSFINKTNVTFTLTNFTNEGNVSATSNNTAYDANIGNGTNTSAMYNYTLNLDPNTKYSFQIFATSCVGDGIKANATGLCQTDNAAPINISFPRLTAEARTTLRFTLPALNEERGLVSCIFIVVGKYQGTRKQPEIYSIAAIKKLTTPTEEYIALAIKYTGSEISKSLGDNTTSSCTLYNQQRDPEIIQATNRPLIFNETYRVYYIIAVEAKLGILFSTSQAETITTAEPPPTTTATTSGESSNADITLPIVGASVALAVILVVILVVLVVKRKRQISKKDDTASSQTPYVATFTRKANTKPTQVPSKANGEGIPLSRFENNYKHLLANNSKGFQNLFEGIANEVAGIELPHTDHTLAENKSKNRYKNIYPFDHSRVVLEQTEESNGYINAAYLDGNSIPYKYIATQGPKKNTVNDFWRMIWEKNISFVVMLTRCIEKKKEKSFKYWPVTGTEVTFGDVTVFTREEAEYGGYWRRVIIITNSNTEIGLPREIIQFHMTKWPDHGVPVSTSNMLRLYNHVIYETQTSSTTYDNVGPLLVHCSAGVGRTGTFVALDILNEQMTKSDQVNVKSCVLNMRMNRTEMIQTLDQLIFLHKIILEIYLLPQCEMTPDDFFNSAQDMERLQQEFNLLNRVPPVKISTKVAFQNRKKNRDQNCIPYDKNRVFIQLLGDEVGGPYINASYIENYMNGFGIIAAQEPLVGDKEYFWRMVWDNDVRVVVRMGGKGFTGSFTLGRMNVSSEEVSENDVFVERSLCLKQEGIKDSCQLYELDFKLWKDVNQLPSATSLLQLVTKMTSLAQNQAYALVLCDDGCGRTGALCAIYLLLERLKTENRIDVFRTVKDLRDARPNMVNSLDLYAYCHEVVKSYIESFNLYGNFQ